MRVRELAPWPRTPAEAEETQRRLAAEVIDEGPAPSPLRTVAGLDVAYAADDSLAAAVVVLDATTLEPVETATAFGRAGFDYVPGLFAFRELPALTAALEKLTTAPDLLIADGQGRAHPRRFGLACHLGLATGLPTVGVAKTPFVGGHDGLGPDRGATVPLRDGDETVGRALRTQAGIRPVFVSVGHRIGLDAACAVVLDLSPRYRLPETTRAADHACRMLLRD